MKRLAKILYTINSTTCIFIGLLHTYTHYADLVTVDLENLMNHQIMVTGMEANVFNLWQGMSLMMGLLLLIIGLSHLLLLNKLTAEEYPPIGGSMIMILMLICVMYTGYNFFGGWQVYGGAAGLILQLICLILSIRKK